MPDIVNGINTVLLMGLAQKQRSSTHRILAALPAETACMRYGIKIGWWHVTSGGATFAVRPWHQGRTPWPQMPYMLCCKANGVTRLLRRLCTRHTIRIR